MRQTLIERMGTKTEPIPAFLGNNLFLKEQENPLIFYLSYREEAKPEEIKKNALQILDSNPLNEREIKYKGDSWKIRKDSNIGEVKKSLDYFKKEFDFDSVSKIYIPWKGPWKGRISDNFGKKLGPIYGELIGGYSLAATPINPWLGLGFAGASLLILSIIEKARRKRRGEAEKEIDMLTKMIHSYEIFKDNLERANIEIDVPKKAREIYSKVQGISKPNNPYESKQINFRKVNKDLLKIYEEVLGERIEL